MKTLVANLFLFTLCTAFLNSYKKVIKFDRYDVCENPKTSPIQWRSIHLKNVNHQFLIFSEGDILRDIESIKLIFKVTRCFNRDLLDSCEHFGSFPIKDGCFLLSQPNGTFFYTFAHSFNPIFNCPFKKDHYVQTNGSFDPSLFAFFPLDGWYWRMIIEFFDSNSNELLFNYCTEGQVLSYRV